MNKDEIKKALECCSNPNTGSCKDCPYNYNDEFHCAYGEMCKAALNLINEQEKEIERLKADKKQAQIDVLNKVKEHLFFGVSLGFLRLYVDELIEEVEKQ